MAKNNKNLAKAAKAKNDEFYTQLYDIENELRHYRDQFRGKTILCNCDDPYESNFFKYFALNFNFFGLKKLICTCYGTSKVMGSELGFWLNKKDNNLTFLPPKNDAVAERKPYKVVITEIQETPQGGYRLSDIEFLLKNKKNVMTVLDGDGDFRSQECIELLKEADIVATNPPFSLFREYVTQLVKYGKKFIILGNKNAITYKEIFPLIKNNKLWTGYTPMSRNLYFEVPVPVGEPDEALTGKYKIIDGKCMSCSPSIWFTNMDVKKRHEDMILYKKYTPEEFPKYDNYDAINIDKTSDIPEDYDGAMGVPITFLDKYNPEQFEIIGLLQSSTDEQAGIPNLRYYNDFKEMRQDMSYTGASGGKANGNPVLQGKSKHGNFLYNENTGEYVHSVYARIVIRNKKVYKQGEPD